MNAGTTPRRYEDLTVGETRRVEPFRFDRDDIVAFATLYDPFPFHLDEEAAAASLLGGLAASGWQTTITAENRVSDHAFADVAIVRGFGARDVRWPRPAMVGVTFTGEATLSALDPDCPVEGCGTAVVSVRLFDPDGEPVMSADFPFAVRRAAAVEEHEG